MNDLILEMFGDNYISLTCEGGECLHFSQIPGYVQPPKKDNTLWLALSAAGAGSLVLLLSAGSYRCRFHLRCTLTWMDCSCLVCGSCNSSRPNTPPYQRIIQIDDRSYTSIFTLQITLLHAQRRTHPLLYLRSCPTWTTTRYHGRVRGRKVDLIGYPRPEEETRARGGNNTCQWS